MNPLKSFNESRRRTQNVTVRVTATAANGEVQTKEAKIKINQINQLAGTGLTGKAVYDLAKHGRCETTDVWGAHYVFEIVKPELTAVEQVEEAKNEEAKNSNTEV